MDDHTDLELVNAAQAPEASVGMNDAGMSRAEEEGEVEEDSQVILEDICNDYDKGQLDHTAIDIERKKRPEEESKPAYYPMQEAIADKVVDRIKSILRLYQGKGLSDFDDFEFQIYTAKFNMLEEQTEKRVCDRMAECFHDSVYEKPSYVRKLAKQRVQKYVWGKAEKQRNEELLKFAQENPKTLYLIIADEAHWGVGKPGENDADERKVTQMPTDNNKVQIEKPLTRNDSKTSKAGAHDKLINCWTNEFKNVIVLQVTATGFNLKSCDSRLLHQQDFIKVWETAAVGVSMDDKNNGDSLEKQYLVTKKRKIYVDKNTGTELKFKNDSKIVEDKLHNVKWAEGHQDKLVQGMVVRLRIPNKKDDEPLWLKQIPSKEPIYSVHVTHSEAESLELIMTGNDKDDVEIKANNSDYQLIAYRAKKGYAGTQYQLGFINTETLTNFIQKNEVCSKFRVHMMCGEDIMELEANVTTQGYLKYDKRIVLGRPPPDEGFEDLGLAIHSNEYSFIVDYNYAEHEMLKEATKQYLSLNFFYNTMRNERLEEQLIRCDEDYISMIKHMVKSQDLDTTCTNTVNTLLNDYMAAEYSYFILMENLFNECDLMDCTVELLNDPERAFGHDHVKRVDKLLQEFCEALKSPKDEIDDRPIEVNIFWSWYKYLCERERKYLIGTFNETSKRKRVKSEIDYEEVARALITCLLCHSSCEMDNLKDILRQKENRTIFHELFQQQRSTFQDFKNIKVDLLSKSETFKMINQVCRKQKLVVVRVHRSGRKSERASPGNRFYHTITMARKIAYGTGHFEFEVIRDFEDFSLSTVTKDMTTPKYRIHFRLQTSKCQHEDAKFSKCDGGPDGQPCEDYQPLEPDLTCDKCHHKHKEIKDYSDLNRLPCILILVDKGRLGDTFPDSFSALDQRQLFNYTGINKPMVKQTDLHLSRMMQELGRLCRYAYKPGQVLPNQEKSSYNQLPYALVGEKLHTCLTEELNKAPVFYGYFAKKGDLDAYIKATKAKNQKKRQAKTGDKSTTSLKTNPVNDMEEMEQMTGSKLHPTQKSFDHNNKEKHENRMLLEAEPQIGKTGVYLKTISNLRKEICKKDELKEGEGEESSSSEEEDEEEGIETEAETTLTLMEEIRRTDEKEAIWRYPFWQDMKSQEYPKVSTGKYDKTRGSSISAMDEADSKLLLHNKNRTKKKKEKAIEQDASLDTFRAHNFSHWCSMCRRVDKSIEKQVSIAENTQVKVSIPYLKGFMKVHEHLGLQTSDLEGTQMNPESQSLESIYVPPHDGIRPQYLETWIFTPSYKRYKDATINYRHTMVLQQEGNTSVKCYYVHFLVVRKEEYALYCRHWGGTHGIIQLPEDIPGIGDTKNGGIGYSRLVIQLFAKQMQCKSIFMIDDNVVSIYEITTEEDGGQEYLLRKGQNLQLKIIPLFKALKHMERQICHPEVQDDKVMKVAKDLNKQLANNVNGLELYTGETGNYAALGCLKDRKGILRVKNPFKKTFVYSLVLLNMDTLNNHEIMYRPIKSREDVDFYERCAKKNLWVCKYNRFILRKLNLRSNIISAMFRWPENVKLLQYNKAPKKPTKEEYERNRLFSWIKSEHPPLNVQWYLPKNKISGLEEWCTKFQNIQNGSLHLLLYFTDKKSQMPFKPLITHFTSTPGIGGFKRHIILLKETFCRTNKLLCRKDFCELINSVFEQHAEYAVFSTHNIEDYDVEYIALKIEGTISNPMDSEAVSNVQVIAKTSVRTDQSADLLKSSSPHTTTAVTGEAAPPQDSVSESGPALDAGLPPRWSSTPNEEDVIKSANLVLPLFDDKTSTIGSLQISRGENPGEEAAGMENSNQVQGDGTPDETLGTVVEEETGREMPSNEMPEGVTGGESEEVLARTETSEMVTSKDTGGEMLRQESLEEMSTEENSSLSEFKPGSPLKRPYQYDDNISSESLPKEQKMANYSQPTIPKGIPGDSLSQSPALKGGNDTIYISSEELLQDTSIVPSSTPISTLVETSADSTQSSTSDTCLEPLQKRPKTDKHETAATVYSPKIHYDQGNNASDVTNGDMSLQTMPSTDSNQGYTNKMSPEEEVKGDGKGEVRHSEMLNNNEEPDVVSDEPEEKVLILIVTP